MSKHPLEVLKNVKTGQRIEAGNKLYVPINKGHFEFDTKERIKAFHEKLAQGWEEDYREYRMAWSANPMHKKVRDYPLLIDMEMASSCNLACPMCYTITDEFKEKVPLKLMDMNLYKKVIDEVAGKVYALRLSLRGEPTLHKKLIEAVRYAKDRGIKEISFLTNGSKLELSYFIQLAEAGVDWITVSFDGTGEEYEKIRKPLKYEETLQKLGDIKNYKERQGLSKPVIKVQSVWPAIRKNPEEFYTALSPVSDLVAFNPLIDYLHNDSDIVYADDFSCPQLYERVVVTSSGLVPMCANDEFDQAVVGNVRNQTIREIWNGEQMKRIREQHKKPNGFAKFDICKKCYYPRKTEVNETTTVGGRRVDIENYINREQVVGK